MKAEVIGAIITMCFVLLMGCGILWARFSRYGKAHDWKKRHEKPTDWGAINQWRAKQAVELLDKAKKGDAAAYCELESDGGYDEARDEARLYWTWSRKTPVFIGEPKRK